MFGPVHVSAHPQVKSECERSEQTDPRAALAKRLKTVPDPSLPRFQLPHDLCEDDRALTQWQVVGIG